MAPSRTLEEQTVLGAVEARGSAMDFSTGSEVPSDDVATASSGSKSVHAPRFEVKTDAKRDALLTEFGKDTLRDRYLLPGESYQDLFARVAAAYSDDAEHAQRVYDYISKLWFMPATPVLSNGGTGRGPADQLLSEQRVRQPRGHRRHLERECLARLQGRRHRHLLGQRPRHRRAGRPQRQDQRHHPVRARDGQPDAGDQPGLAAPRLGRLLPRHQPSRDRGIPRDPQTLGRLQPQGAQPPPRRARHRRVHGSGARRRRVRPAQPQGRVGARQGRRPLVVPEAGRDPPRDRRAVHHLHRPGEPVDAQASPRPRPQGHDLEPLLARSRCRPAATISAPTAPRCAACRRSASRPGTSGTATSSSSRTSCASSTMCSATISPAPRTRWRAPSTAPSASAASASA